jgi:hypothetical protein
MISGFSIILVAVSVLFVACETDKEVWKEKKQIEVKKEEISELNLSKKDEKVEKDLLNRLGFEFKDEKIIIDINKTSNFFSEIEREMERKAKEIESKIAQSDINVSEGIVINGDQVGIDLNRTTNMLQQINILMKDILLDVNSSRH